MEVTITGTDFRPKQQPPQQGDFSNCTGNEMGAVGNANSETSFKNATSQPDSSGAAGGWSNIANIFGPNGVQGKLTIDVPDTTYLKIFGAVGLGVAVGMTIGALVGGLIKRRLAK